MRPQNRMVSLPRASVRPGAWAAACAAYLRGARVSLVHVRNGHAHVHVLVGAAPETGARREGGGGR